MAKKLIISPTVKKVHRAFRLYPRHAELLADLAAAYGSSQTKVVEAILDTYGPVLLRDRRQELEKEKGK